MSYKTFDIVDGELIISASLDPCKGVAATTNNTLKGDVENTSIDTESNPMDNIYNGDYHAQADAECILLDDDIYFS